MDSYEQLTRTLLARAGVELNGREPHDIQVRDRRFFRRAILGGNLGLGESYMEGWWECEALDELIARLLLADVARAVPRTARLAIARASFLLRDLSRLLRRARSTEQHYEVGNELYERMLDSRMTYSCAYFQSGARTLEQAQEAKLDLCCRKLGLQRGQRLLDIGSGWGSLAKFAAERYGVSVVGVTISPQQLEAARARCRGLPIEFVLLDYRRIRGRFDCAVSLGMFEHVGYRHYGEYMAVVERALSEDGVFLLETIGGNVSVHASDPWFAKYIWNSPSSMYPSIRQLGQAFEGRFVVEDWHNFGADYDPTLGAWADNVERDREWIVATRGDRFYRMWRYYLRSCQGGFRARAYQMWQIVLARRGRSGGYQSVR